jgi:hypothetical protein
MIPHGFQLPKQIIPSESQNTQGSVGLVALLLVHRGAPEIVEKYIDERRMRSQISVVFDRTDVVEDEATVTAVVVTRDAGEHHHGTQRLVQCHFAHWVSGA